MPCNISLWPIKFIETGWHISWKLLSLCTTSTATECPAHWIVSILPLVLCTPTKPEVLLLANTSVNQSIPIRKKISQVQTKAQESGDKQIPLLGNCQQSPPKNDVGTRLMKITRIIVSNAFHLLSPCPLPENHTESRRLFSKFALCYMVRLSNVNASNYSSALVCAFAVFLFYVF